MAEAVTIKNRNGQKIAVLLDLVEPQKGLAFIMHGLGGFKEQSHLEVMAHSFNENKYSVVRFDTTNTYGQSDGRYENATTTNYFEDLEDIISWASAQFWYQQPFCVVGHSLGGICVALYAQKYPEKVKGLAPISTVVSGALSLETPKRKGYWEEWQKTGWEEHESASQPGLIKRLPWSHMEDRLKYDLLENINTLTMPTLLIVGDQDDSTPPAHQQILFEKLPGKKEIHILKNAPHTFKEPQHLEEIQQIFSSWIQNVL